MPNYPYDEIGTQMDRTFVQGLNKNFDDIEQDLNEVIEPLQAVLDGKFDDASLATEFEARAQAKLEEIEPHFYEFQAETTAQLSQIDKGHVKRLKQPLCANVFAHAEFTVPFLKSQIDEYIDLGLDGIIVVIHLDYENGAMKPRENMSNVMEMISYAKSKGLTIEALKIHWKKEGSSHADPVPEEEKPAYEAYVNTLATQFIGITSKITIFNEKDNVTNFSSNDAFVNRVIANVKAKGFKVGMSINDLQYYGMNLNLLNDLDFIGYNMYPVVGWKRDKTTLQDCLDAINVSPEKKILYDLIELFPDKEVVISEFGIKDYYAYYASPTDWKYDIPSDKSNGRVAKNYYQALFEVVNGKMDGIWTWYEIYLPDSIKMFQNWTGGTNK